MATNKSLLAEQIIRAIAKGDPSSDFPIKIPEVILAIPIWAQKLVEADYLAKKNIDTRWLTTFKNIEVLKDDDLDLKYSIIPAQYMDLPDQCGLYHISPMKDQGKKFKVVSPSFFAMYQGTEAENIGGYVGFWVEGNKVYYTKAMDGIDYNCTEVLMKLVCSLDAYGDYDDIFISGQAQFDIIASFAAYYKAELVLPGDTITDNRYLAGK